MARRFYTVDVFAERPFAGNPLAVVVSDEALAEDVMQAIAAEVNYSETTFASPSPAANGCYRVRIFTPAREIAFAGHPILGTAWVIRHRLAPHPVSHVTLDLGIGRIGVDFEPGSGADDVAWFTAPPMALGPVCPAPALATALGIERGDIDMRAPARRVSAGTAAIIVPLRSLDALGRARLDLQAFAPLAAAGFPPLVYLFCLETREEANDLSARFFFEAHGVREDPATGNGAAFLGAYLMTHRFLPDAELDLRIEQGHEMHRPSIVMLRASPGRVRVGGRVVPVVEGVIA